jgi:hypothetical protein
MSTASALLFAAVPIIAAFSLDTDTFVPFLILFCVIAGLSISGNNRHSDSARNDVKRHISKAGSKLGSRSVCRQKSAEFSRF